MDERAAMVDSPSAYKWSSYETNARGLDDPMITPHAEYLALASEPTLRRSAYAQLFEPGEDDAFLAAIRDATSGGYPLLADDTKLRLANVPDRRRRRERPGPRSEAGVEEPPSLDLPF
jgi:putative transposase